MKNMIRKVINYLRFKFGIDKIERGAKITQAIQIKKILLPIPPEKFITDYFGKHGTDNSCFLGHINRALSLKGQSDYMGDWDGYGARDLTYKFLSEEHGIHTSGVEVNNAPNVNGYTEPVIKDRVMHMVEDMIKAGY